MHTAQLPQLHSAAGPYAPAAGPIAQALGATCHDIARSVGEHLRIAKKVQQCDEQAGALAPHRVHTAHIGHDSLHTPRRRCKPPPATTGAVKLDISVLTRLRGAQQGFERWCVRQLWLVKPLRSKPEPAHAATAAAMRMRMGQR
jgi:hypothetical protein